MAKKKIDVAILEKRIDLLEMQVRDMKVIEPNAIDERLKNIEEALYSSKEMLTSKEVCQYLDISQSLLYKLTCSARIPHYKPRGKMLYFDKTELDAWLKQNNVPTLGNIIGDEGCGMGREEANAASEEEQKKNKRVPYFARVRYSKRNKQ